MSSLGRVLVGYRENDRARLKLLDEHGQTAVPTRKCVAGCGHVVYFNPSGMRAMSDQDPEVICTVCAELYRRDLELVEL